MAILRSPGRSRQDGSGGNFAQPAPQHQQQQQQQHLAPSPRPGSERAKSSFSSRHSSDPSNPNYAINEPEPYALQQQQQNATTRGISQMSLQDHSGRLITDPDKSNPARWRSERPLDTIRSFQTAANGTNEALHNQNAKYSAARRGQPDPGFASRVQSSPSYAQKPYSPAASPYAQQNYSQASLTPSQHAQWYNNQQPYQSYQTSRTSYGNGYDHGHNTPPSTPPTQDVYSQQQGQTQSPTPVASFTLDPPKPTTDDRPSTGRSTPPTSPMPDKKRRSLFALGRKK